MNEHAVPILPSRDLRESLGFYEKLGFENRGAPPEEWNYMILGRASIELHFIGETTSFAEWTAPTSCHLAVADADALHAEWAQAGVTAEVPGRPTTGCVSSRSLTRVETSSESVRSPLPSAAAGRARSAGR